jgi:hypothetical protein
LSGYRWLVADKTDEQHLNDLCKSQRHYKPSQTSPYLIRCPFASTASPPGSECCPQIVKGAIHPVKKAPEQPVTILTSSDDMISATGEWQLKECVPVPSEFAFHDGEHLPAQILTIEALFG